MQKKLSELIDFEKVNVLLEGFNKTTGFLTAILDLDGNVLSRSGWRQICTDFHRINKETALKCKISDTELAGKLAEGEKYHFYKCLNGLVDVAVPIVINGEHIANLFSGQFLFEEPDKDFFIKQAKKYGFKIDAYLSALEKVPVVSQQKVNTAMDFLLNMTQLISETAFQKLEQIELNKTIRESEEKYRLLHEAAGIGIGYYTTEGVVISYNTIAAQNMNGKPEDFAGKSIFDLFPKQDAEFYLNRIKKASVKEIPQVYEDKVDLPEGSRWFNSVYTRIIDSGNQVAGIQIISTDITERKLTEEARLKFEMLADSSSEFIGMCDLELNPLYVNPSGIRMVGLPDIAAACQVKVQDYFFPEDQKFITEEFFPRVLREGHGDVEIRLRNFQTGEPIWMFYYLFHVRDTNGNIVGWATVSRNITERKKAEEALLEGEERLRLSTELANVAVWEFDFRTKSMKRSRNHDQLYGIEIQTEWNHKTYTDMIHPDEKGIANQLIHQSIAVGGPDFYSYDFRVIYPDKSIHWLMTRGQVAERNEKGEGLLVRGILMDITERKQAEKELKDSEERLRLSTELANVAVWELNFKTKAMSRSENHDQLYGLKKQEKWEYETFLNATHPDDRDYSNKIIQKSAAPGGPDKYKFDFRVIHPDGTEHWLMQTGQVIKRNLKGKAEIVRGTLIDISDRKNIEAEIIKLNKELEMRVEERTSDLSKSQVALMNLVEDLNEKTIQLEKSKQQLETKNKELETFSYSVSHDLKAPLRGIDGYSRLLQELYSDNLNDEAKHFINTIRSGTKQMNQLIEDLLAYSRLERTILRQSSLNVGELVSNTLLLLNEDIVKHKIKITKDIPDFEILADRDGMSIALRNVLENAIKFSSNNELPEIKITAKENVYSWILSVTDNGIGFDMKYHNRIFEIFQRLNLSEQYPGTGIGLAMVHKSMDRMGGKVWAESKPGKGATFFLEITKQP